jgi:hypothetical protein
VDVPICDGCNREILPGRAYLIAVRERPDETYSEKIDWDEADAPDIVGRYHEICSEEPRVKAKWGPPRPSK